LNQGVTYVLTRAPCPYSFILLISSLILCHFFLHLSLATSTFRSPLQIR